MSMLISDNMPELDEMEFPIYRGLTQEQQAAFACVRDQAQDATRRLKEAKKLPDEALLVIGNVVAMTIYRSRQH